MQDLGEKGVEGQRKGRKVSLEEKTGGKARWRKKSCHCLLPHMASTHNCCHVQWYHPTIWWASHKQWLRRKTLICECGYSLAQKNRAINPIHLQRKQSLLWTKQITLMLQKGTLAGRSKPPILGDRRAAASLSTFWHTTPLFSGPWSCCSGEIRAETKGLETSTLLLPAGPCLGA